MDDNKPQNLKYDKSIFKPGDTHILYDKLNREEEANIYFISTPGQMLSAIEAQNYFKTKNNILIILFFVVRDGKNIDQIFNLSKLFPYDMLVTYQNANKFNFYYFYKFIKTLKQYKYKKAFIGYYTPLYRRMIANINYKNLIFLDSGDNSIEVQNLLYNKNYKNINYDSFATSSLKGKAYWILYYILGLKKDIKLNQIDFFTVYKLKPYQNENIINHNYTYLRELLKSDIDRYISILLMLHNSNINGFKKILTKTLMLDLPLKEKTIYNTVGVSLDLYSQLVNSVDNYSSRLINNIYLQEKKFLSENLTSDKTILKRIQYAYIFKEKNVLENTLNLLIDTLIKRLLDVLSEKDINIKRVEGALSTLNEALKIKVDANNRLKEDIQIDRFYEFYEIASLIFEKHLKSNEKLKILTLMIEVFTNYSNGLNDEKDIKQAEQYFPKNRYIFKHKVIDCLVKLSDTFYEKDSAIRKEAFIIYIKSMEQKTYRKNSRNFYKIVKIADKLNKNLNYLTSYFIISNLKISNISQHLEALEILLNKGNDFKRIRDRLWDIYSKATFSREYRIKAGLILVKAYYKRELEAKANKLFMQIWKKMSCKSRDEALDYIETAFFIKLYKTNIELFESLYNRYIFGPFLNTYNSQVVLDFIKYQNELFKIKSSEQKIITYKPQNLKYDKSIFKPGDTHILYDKLNREEEANIYFISTPGQMLSAIEAQNYFKTKNNILVILFFVVRDGKNIDQMSKLSKLFPYDMLLTYQNKSAKFYISYIPFLQKMKKFKTNYLFIGFNTILYRRFVANIDYKKLYYLDDGVHTITTHQDIYKYSYNKKFTKPEYIPFPKTLNFLKVKFIYGKSFLKADANLKDLNFFTVYNLKQLKNEHIVKHNFSYVRSLFINKQIPDDKVYVLGQPLVEQVGVKQENYNNYLISLFKYYGNKDIIFIPHRLEKIDETIKIYMENNGIALFIPNEPIEFYFLNNKIYPGYLASFITSALFNIKKIFPKTDAKAFEIDLSELDKHQQRGITLIYKHFENENIKLIKMAEYLQ